MDIIVCSGHGSFDAFEATLANAKEILSWQTISQEVVSHADAPPASYATYETVEKVIRKLLKADDGEVVFKSRTSGETIVATPEARKETALYLFDKQISQESLSPYVLKSKCNIKDLAWLAYFHDCTLVDQWIVDQANTYRTINEDKWKEGASEVSKVRYVVRFVNELCHRDEKYEVVAVKAEA